MRAESDPLVTLWPVPHLAHILIVGSGGREHALAWKLAQSPRVDRISVAPGNAGMPNPVPIAVTDVDGLLAWAQREHPDLTVIGPEMALAAGIVDRFMAAGLKVYGPTQAAAQIETSKVFAKRFMQRYGIPTAPFDVFDNARDALRYAMLDGEQPLAIKADGLAAGKGVIMTDCAHDAEAAIRTLMIDGQVGSAGSQIVIEKALRGEEISVMAFCDGEQAYLMPFAQDHKRAFDGDRGPNTGGMGAVAPVSHPFFTESHSADVIIPALHGLVLEGNPFRGVLFAGVMLTADGPFVLEYNCRWGDPETQVVLPLLDNDLYSVLIGEEAPRWSADRHAATVIMASGGYPGSYPTGLPITGFESVPDDVLVFQAGTRRDEAAGNIVTAGGRVLSVTGQGNSLQAAIDRAYAGVKALKFDGAQYRTDIGAKAVSAAHG